MFSSVLIIHILGAVASFAVAGSLVRVTIRSDREAIRRHLPALASLMVFDGATGVLLAVSSATPALAVCDNIAYYVATFIGVALFSSWYPARADRIRIPVLRPLILGSVIPFAPAVVASLLGF